MSSRPSGGQTYWDLFERISSMYPSTVGDLSRSDYKTAHASQTDALLQDRGRIDSSHRMMDDTLKYGHPGFLKLIDPVKPTLREKTLHSNERCSLGSSLG